MSGETASFLRYQGDTLVSYAKYFIPSKDSTDLLLCQDFVEVALFLLQLQDLGALRLQVDVGVLQLRLQLLLALVQFVVGRLQLLHLPLQSLHVLCRTTQRTRLVTLTQPLAQQLCHTLYKACSLWISKPISLGRDFSFLQEVHQTLWNRVSKSITDLKIKTERGT